MQTKRCAKCQKVSRADAVTCGRCGQSYLPNVPHAPYEQNTSRVLSRSALATRGSSKRGTVVEEPKLYTRRQTIPPASPHRAGHYSGLHPEDQPYQSSMIAVQHPPEKASDSDLGARKHQDQLEPDVTYSPGLPRDLPELPTLSTLPKRSEVTVREVKVAAGNADQRYVPAPVPVATETTRDKHVLHRRYVPTLLTLSCLIFLVASSLLAYAFINKRPAQNTQVLSAIPNQLRVNDTFTLSGKGFGLNDPIAFTHDQNDPILDGNGRPLKAHADDTGVFSVQIVVPLNWSVGQHAIHAIDSGKDQTLSVLEDITVEQSSLAPPAITVIERQT